VKTAGNVRGRDEGHHAFVVPDRLSDVGVQVDLHTLPLSNGGHPCNSSLIAVGAETQELASSGQFPDGTPVAY
jgi:hypothetical protein